MRQSLIQLHLPDDQAFAGRTGSFAQQIRATAYFLAEFSLHESLPNYSGKSDILSVTFLAEMRLFFFSHRWSKGNPDQ
jgi:hypothetical protein